MRLLFVGTSRTGGGTESHFITLVRTMHEAGYAVAAVVNPGTPIHTGLTGSGVALHDGVFRNAVDPRGIRAVWKACRQFKPDWIIGSFSKEYWPLAILAKLLGVKLALFKHMDLAMRPATHYFIPRMADRFIVISDFMAKRFSDRGVPSGLIQVLHNPLDLNYFKPDHLLRQATRLTMAYADNDIVLGFIGALHPGKGIFQLADAVNQAMQQVPNLKAIWVGEGQATSDLAERIRSGGFTARHNSYKWADDVRPYYAAMDLLALPSVESETFGRVSIEAQACGVPVLCSDIGGIPETLSPGVTGLLLKPGDVTAWRNAIIMLANDLNKRKKMSEQGRSWVAQQFSAQVIGHRFVELLQDGDSK